MEKKLRVLGIAPYDGMKNLMMRLVDEYPQIELTTLVGDLEQGLDIARKNFHKNYDAVISRGMTAHLLHQLPLPVIDVEISMYDILCALKLANTSNQRTAIVSFTDITDIAMQLCQLIDYKIDIYTVASADTVEQVLRKCQEHDYASVLCDMVVNETARKLGMNSFLITSGIDSVRHAFDQVIKTCSNQRNLRNENQMLRELINGQISQTVLFDTDKNVILSTVEEPSDELLSMLEDEIEETKQQKERHITRIKNGRIYSIRAAQMEANDSPYTVFFFTQRKSPLPTDKSGITFLSKRDAEKAYYNSMFYFAGTLNMLQNQITKIKNTNYPILISGENGTGKESLAYYLYMQGGKSNNALVVIDCYLLNDRGWEFLYEHHASPLAATGYTICFQNIDRISPLRSSRLLANLTEMETCSNNQVYFSCVYGTDTQCLAAGSMFADKLCAISILVPSLREQKDCIPILLNKTLSALNTELPHKLAGAENEAMKTLQDYHWPNNFSQFKRVTRELAITSSGSFVTQEDVNGVLQKEQYIGYVSESEESYQPVNLHRPMKEIESDIVCRVMKETGGNQTEVAKILKISRTTLWRMIKAQSDDGVSWE